MRALGATPVWFSVGTEIAGLDGIEQQVYAVEGNRFDRIGKYLTANVVFWPRPLVLFANAKAFAALTPTQRSILRRAAADDIGAETAVVRGQEHEATTTLCRAHRLRFLSASSRDLAALRRAVQPVYAQLERDPRTRRYLAQIEVLRAQGGHRCRRPPGLQRAGADPRLGRDAGRRRLAHGHEVRRRAGRPPADGRELRQLDLRLRPRPLRDHAGVQRRLHLGVWRVHGARTRDGVGFHGRRRDRPNSAENKPGESFRFGWSLYRETLALTPVRGAISPFNFRDKPWRRISATPSTRYLSKRCPPPAQALSR